jgi:hypothetical protein
MMNRASAQSGAEQAKEEGIEPLKEYVKELVDDVLESEFNCGDLEFSWADEVVVDEQKQTEIITEKVASGLITVNRGRELMGEDKSDDPGADVLMLKTATGYVPIGAQTIDGKKEAIAAGIVADPTIPPTPAFGAPGAGGGGGKGPPGKTAPAKTPTKPAPPAKAKKLAMARGVMGVFKARGVIEPVPFPFPPSRNGG